MRQSLILLLCLVCLIGKADNVTTWLKAEGIKTVKPMLANVKNVNNKVFSNNEVLLYNSQDVSKFNPVENKQLLDLDTNPMWTKATNEDKNILSTFESDNSTISYFATYLETNAWFKGSLKLTVYCPVEIYINGTLKDKFYGKPAEKGTVRNINLCLENGKHSIIVKTLAKTGKAFSAEFNKAKEFAHANTNFSISPKRGMNIYDILHGVKPGSVSVSAEGEYALVSYSRVMKPSGKSKRWSDIVCLKDNKIVYTFNGSSASGIKWLPKGNVISWAIKNEEGKSIYIYDADSKQINHVASDIKGMKYYYWSPEMSYLVYTSTKNYAEKNWILRNVQGMEDRQASFRYRSSIYKYDLKTKQSSLLNWGNRSLNLHDISKDGKKMIASTSGPDYSEYPYSKQNVYMLDLVTMHVDTIWKNRKESVSCNFSPDGKKLLIKAGGTAFGKKGLNIKDSQISNGFDYQLYIYDLATKNVDAITYDFDPNITAFQWHKDGNIYVTAQDKDYASAFKYNTKKKNWSKIECPGDYLRSVSIADNSNLATYIACTATSPYKVYVTDLKKNKTSVVSDPESYNYKDVKFGEIKDWNFTMENGNSIVGRYYLPKNFDANKKYPLLVYYYGGTSPVSRYFGGRYPFNVFADNGYVVYVLQPSGATGFGQEFAARHQNNWCKITADEIIYGVKKFTKDHSFINKDKIACMGASYGGFTTEFLQTQTDIFACAVSHAGISSISSYWGEGYWGYSYSTQATAHAFPWNRKDIYVDQSSLFNADKIKTPMLLLHGTKDVNVPTGESIQFYTALKLVGVDVNLVLINGADHIIYDYKQRIKWNNTIMAYLAKYLKDQPQWWNNMYPEKNL